MQSNEEIVSLFQTAIINSEEFKNRQLSSEEVASIREMIGTYFNTRLTQDEFVIQKNALNFFKSDDNFHKFKDMLSDYKKIKILFWTSITIISASVLTAVYQYARADTILNGTAKKHEIKTISQNVNTSKDEIENIKKILKNQGLML